MSNPPLTQAVAMDLNGTGTLVDVTSYLSGPDGIAKTATRTDQFVDAVGATFTFTLSNYDGRFTPGNTSTYSNPPTERMTVCWEITNGTVTRCFSGAILTMTPSTDNWARITIVCDDMLGAASRNTLGDLAYMAVMNSDPYFFYPFNDAVGSSTAAEVTGHGTGIRFGQGQGFITTFGTAAVPGLVDTQLSVTGSPGEGDADTYFNQTYPLGSFGFIGCWITLPAPNSGPTNGVYVYSPPLALVIHLRTGQTSGGSPGVYAFFTISSGATLTTITTSVVAASGAPQYWSAGVTYSGSSTFTYVLNLYLNGSLVATASTTSTYGFTGSGPTTPIGGVIGAFNAITFTLSHFSHTPTLMHEEYVGVTSEANRLATIALTTPQVSLTTLPTDLSTAPVGYAETSGQSALDAFNAVMKTEQGYIDCVTTGTLTSPVQTVRVRARNRPSSPTYFFNSVTELDSAPQLVRDSTNLVWSDAVTGANSSSLTVSQNALQLRAGSNNVSDAVLTYQTSDLYEYGSDRLWRGANVALRPVSIVVDNCKCPTDRTADLLAMVPGDRIQVTNIPSTVLGFTTWDGWLLDKEELHTVSEDDVVDRFTLYLQPCQPTTGIFDTDLFENGGNNLLTTAMTTGTTSAIVGSVDGVTWFEQSAVNYYIQIDSEVMKVTAAAAPSGGNQTLTVTRAQNSTTATTHAIGAAPEVVDNSSDVPNNAIWAY